MMLSAERRRFIVLVLYCLVYGLLALYSERWLLRETEGRLADDFGIYYLAYSRARAGENPYVPYKIGLSFIYHPFALTWISLFDWHSIRTTAILWMMAGASAWIASLVLALRLLVGEGPSRQVPPPRKVWVYLALFLMLTFAPLGESIHVGQINGFVTLCIIVILYGSERPGLAWEVVASVALGLAVLLKTSPIVLMLYLLALRRYRLSLLTILTMAILSLMTAIQFSPALVLQFADTLLRIGSGIHYSGYNHSILRLAWQMLRALGMSGIDGWLVRVLQAAWSMFFALSSGSAWLTVTSRKRTRLLLFNLLLALMVVSSPIVWYHHSTLLVLPILSLILHQDRRVRWLGLAAVLLIQSERALDGAGITSGAWTGLPALAGQMVILLLFTVLYLHDRWPMLRARSRLALWRRYSGGV